MTAVPLKAGFQGQLRKVLGRGEKSIGLRCHNQKKLRKFNGLLEGSGLQN